VIEIEAGQHGSPPASGVAGVAGLLELTPMRIEVARRANIELHIPVSRRRPCGIGLVALLAFHFAMQPGKWIAGPGVIELFCSFPAFHGMALCAFVTELAFVRIGVARRAIRKLGKERFGRVLVLDERFGRRKHVRRGVAFFTGNAGVLAFERVAG